MFGLLGGLLGGTALNSARGLLQKPMDNLFQSIGQKIIPQGLLNFQGQNNLPMQPEGINTGDPYNQAMQSMGSTINQSHKVGFDFGFGSDQNRMALAQIGGIIGGPKSGAGQYAASLNDNALKQSQAGYYDAQTQNKGMPFGGDSFDNQLVQQRAREYMKNGLPADQAFSKAANDVLQTKQSYVADPLNPGSLIPVGNKGLPPLASGAVPGIGSEIYQPTGNGPISNAITIPGPNGEPPQRVSGQINPPLANPYANSGAVQLEAAKKTAEAQVAKEIAQPQAEAALKTSLSELDNVINKTYEVGQQATPQTTGFAGALFSGIPGSPAHDMSKNVVMLNANAFIKSLSDMRAQSKTGGAVGNVTEAEGEKLQSKYASLAQSQSTAQFQKNLADFQNMMINARKNLIEAYQKDYGYAPDLPPIPSMDKSAPAGVPANVWNAMSPEERALWK